MDGRQNFSAWHQAAQRLLDNLQAAVQLGEWHAITTTGILSILRFETGQRTCFIWDFSAFNPRNPLAGASQHAQLQLLLLQRSAADKAYAQAGG